MPTFKEWLEDEVSKLNSLIEEFGSNAVPHDVSSLLLCAINQEMTDELNFLRELIDTNSGYGLEQIKEAVKARCKIRSFQNEGTALSFTAFPDGHINKLYIEIVTKLFGTEDVALHFSILFPGTEYVVSISYEDTLPPEYHHATQDEKRKYLYEREPKLDRQDPSTLEIDTLSLFILNFVFYGNIAFDLRSIQFLNFTQQVNVYRIIKATYPELLTKIYSHNIALQQLESDIQVDLNKGLTPRDALQKLVKDLMMSGSHMTGDDFASSRATTALCCFEEYFKKLPSTSFENINGLVTIERKSFSSIWKDLLNQNCVETAAHQIQEILKNPVNSKVLDFEPGLSRDWVREIESKYKKKPEGNWFSTLEENNFSLPQEFIKKTLRKINIDNEESMIVLLLSFHPSYYDDIFQSIEMIDQYYIIECLMQYIKMEMFSVDQTKFLIEALLKHISEYITFSETLYTFELSNNKELIRGFLEPLSEEERIAAVTHYKEKVVVNAAKNPDALRVLLALIPRHTCLKLLTIRGHMGMNILHYAVQYPDSLKALSEFTDILVYINTTDERGYSLLHHACRHINSLIFLLELYPPEKRAEPIMREFPTVQSILSLLTQEPINLGRVLTSLDESQRYEVLDTATRYIEDNLHKVEYNEELITLLSRLTPKYKWVEVYIRSKILLNLEDPQVLETYLGSQEKNDILNAITYGDLKEGRFLKRISNRPNIIVILLKSLSESKREVICELYLLNILPYMLDIEFNVAIEILELLPEKRRFQAITFREAELCSLLQRTVHFPTFQLRLLKLLPGDERVVALKSLYINGNPIITEITSLPHHLEVYLTLVPTVSRLELLLHMGRYRCLLDKVFMHSKSLDVVLSLLNSDEERLSVIHHIVKKTKSCKPYATLKDIKTPFCQFLYILLTNNIEGEIGRNRIFRSNNFLPKFLDLICLNSIDEIVRKVLEMFNTETMEAEMLLNTYCNHYFGEASRKYDAFQSKIGLLVDYWKLNGLLRPDFEYTPNRRKRKHQSDHEIISKRQKLSESEDEKPESTSRKRGLDNYSEFPRKRRKLTRLSGEKRDLEGKNQNEEPPSKKVSL